MTLDTEDVQELDGHATALACALDALSDAASTLRQAERRVQDARSVVRQVAARLGVLAEERRRVECAPPMTLVANDTKGTD